MNLCQGLPYFIVLRNKQKEQKMYIYPPQITWKFHKIALKAPKDWSIRLTIWLFFFMFPPKLPLVLQMSPLLLRLIFKNICKNTKPCEFTCVKNKELFSLILQQILRLLKLPECLKPQNIQSPNEILLIHIKKKKCVWVVKISSTSTQLEFGLTYDSHIRTYQNNFQLIHLC